MKKSLRIMSVIILALFVFYATERETHANEAEQTISMKIEKATYSEVDGVFYVYTVRDAEGGFWTMSFEPRKGETLTQFKKRSIGHYLIVKYIGTVQTDEQIELTAVHIW